jgi:SAM-dependent methyltransferase
MVGQSAIPRGYGRPAVREFENRARASSFGADAEQYDRARPSYPVTLVDDLMAESPRDVVDIGCGTAKAGRLFAARGCAVVGIEPDARMAEVARRYLPVVEVAAFEGWDAAGRTFDLAVCGQAWHWVHPVDGAARLAHVVRPGGRIAVFWNLGRHEDAIRPAIDAVYERFASSGVDNVLGNIRDGDHQFIEPLVATGAFGPVEVRTYSWEQRYTREEWLDQLPTHSDHRLLPDDQRALLMDAVGAAIDDFGSSFTMRYDTEVITATRS